jgi:hypothetical protein
MVEAGETRHTITGADVEAHVVLIGNSCSFGVASMLAHTPFGNCIFILVLFAFHFYNIIAYPVLSFS